MKKNKKKEETWYRVVAERVTHFIVGIVSFATLALPVVLIFEANEYIKTLGVDDFTMFILHGVELAWMMFDTYVTVRYIARKIYQDFEDEDEDEHEDEDN